MPDFPVQSWRKNSRTSWRRKELCHGVECQEEAGTQDGTVFPGLTKEKKDGTQGRVSQAEAKMKQLWAQWEED